MIKVTTNSQLSDRTRKQGGSFHLRKGVHIRKSVIDFSCIAVLEIGLISSTLPLRGYPSLRHLQYYSIAGICYRSS
jgi:hypothetical protein